MNIKNMPRSEIPPSAEQIKSERIKAKLTQTKAAQLIYKTMNAWQKWEGGKVKMDPALWEYWLLLVKSTGQ